MFSDKTSIYDKHRESLFEAWKGDFIDSRCRPMWLIILIAPNNEIYEHRQFARAWLIISAFYMLISTSSFCIASSSNIFKVAWTVKTIARTTDSSFLRCTRLDERQRCSAPTRRAEFRRLTCRERPAAGRALPTRDKRTGRRCRHVTWVCECRPFRQRWTTVWRKMHIGLWRSGWRSECLSSA